MWAEHLAWLEERGRLPGVVWQHTDGVLRLPTQHAQHRVLLGHSYINLNPLMFMLLLLCSGK